MSGHSKWSTIKRKKGALDAKRGKVFSRLVREIMTAARMGGSDPDANPRLRTAIIAAKAQNLPADTIQRGIKKGAGELDGPPVEEIVYEGYGAGGVAFIVEAQSDNRNRTSAEVRAAFNKNNGNLGASGSVAWMFHKHGRIACDAAACPEDRVLELTLEAGAEDVVLQNEEVVVLTEPHAFADVVDVLEKANVALLSAELTMIPDTTVAVEGKQAESVLSLYEKLEDLDDVMCVHANFDIADSELERLAQ